MPRSFDIFTRHRDLNPHTDFGYEFARPFRRLLIYHRDHNGALPVSTAKDADGYPIGSWYANKCTRPHELTEVQRVALLSIPGVNLKPSSSVVKRARQRSRSERIIFERLTDWIQK